MNVKFNFDETNVQVGFENQFVVRDLTDKTLVKILMLKGDKGDAGSIKFHVVNELPTENIDTTAIYLVPSADPSTGNTYDEWVYINNQWEKLGETPITVDLTDYVKNTDYATDSVGGVIKTDWGTGTYMSNGKIQARVSDYATYSTLGISTFIGKGTLENVLTAKIGDINSVLDAINNEVI